MVKWQSSVTPRFLTESDKATDAPPTLIESGKKKEIWIFYPRRRSLLQSCRTLLKFVQCHPGFNGINTFLHREEEVRDLMRQ